MLNDLLSLARLWTEEVRVGVVGLHAAGKTVFLTSLINHLRDHDPDREDSKRPGQQTDEESGSIKRRQRGEDDFQGHGDTPRGSEPETRATSGRRS